MPACLLKVCVLAATITHGGSYSIEDELPKEASSYCGVTGECSDTFDVSRFYKEKNHPFNLGGTVLLDTGTRFDITYDSGVDTEKLDVGQAVTIGVKQYHRLNENWSLEYGGGTRLGGKVTHTPCFDDLDRAYFCGNLTSWEEFQAPKYEMPWNVSAKLTYNF